MPKKEKVYDFDFEQNLGTGPVAVNKKEKNSFAKPGWLNVKKGSPRKEDKANNALIQDPAPKQYEWEKPNWAVAPLASDAAIVKDPVVKPNQHPVLKTSKQAEAEREIEELKRRLEEAKRLKEQMLREKQQTSGSGGSGVAGTAPGTSGAATHDRKTETGGVGAGASGDSVSAAGEGNNTKEMTEELKLEALRLENKAKEDAAWRARENERREEQRRQREIARLQAQALANKSRDDTSWQQKK